MMVSKVKKDVVANTLITSADYALIVMVSLIVSLSFIILSTYVDFIRDNNMLAFTIFEALAFCGILAYKRYWK